MKKLLLSLVLLLGSASAINAGEFGAAHNRYLDCLRKTLPQVQVSARDIMSALVNNCRYAPPEGTEIEFVGTYSRLLESTMRSVQAGGLSAVVNSYRDRFTAMHMSYLGQIESIVKTQNSRDADVAGGIVGGVFGGGVGAVGLGGACSAAVGKL